MKKIGLILVALVLAVATVNAEGKMVPPESLPQKAKDFIAANFAGKSVGYAEKEFNEYEVQLNSAPAASEAVDSMTGATAASNVEIKFNGKGEWKTIKSYGGVPAAVLLASITSYVTTNFADAKIVEAEKEKNRIELKLSTGMEVFFDKNGKFLGQKFDD